MLVCWKEDSTSYKNEILDNRLTKEVIKVKNKTQTQASSVGRMLDESMFVACVWIDRNRLHLDWSP
jgi:hypothetical protein